MTLNGQEGLSPDPDLARFARNLLKLRTAARLSRTALGHQISASAKSIENWEYALYNPPVRAIIGLARLFGITTDQLLNLELDLEEEGARLHLLTAFQRDMDKLIERMDALEANLASRRETRQV